MQKGFLVVSLGSERQAGPPVLPLNTKEIFLLHTVL